MAIAFDVQSTGDADGVSSITFSHTVATGDDLAIMVGAFDQNVDTITGITYDSTSLTQDAKVTINSNSTIYMYHLLNPSTGANNVVVSRSVSTNNLHADAVSYSGIKQSSQPDATATNDTTGTTINTSITTVADNCWSMMYVRNTDGAVTASTNSTDRSGGGGTRKFFDSNADITPAGSFTMTVTVIGGTTGVAMASMAPAAEDAAVVRNLMTLGVGR